MLSLEDGKKLIGLAKKTIEFSFEDKKPSLDDYSEYDSPRGVFVTLHKNGALRGCIGYPEPVHPLNEGLVRASIAAAFQDPRFPPLEKEELGDVEFEISVLTIPEEVKSIPREDVPEHIEIGRDGLIIEKPYTSGLLLPQVAPEQGWNPVEFLENTCLKASLEKSAWKEDDTRIYTFQAQIFSESEGDVIERQC